MRTTRPGSFCSWLFVLAGQRVDMAVAGRCSRLLFGQAHTGRGRVQHRGHSRSGAGRRVRPCSGALRRASCASAGPPVPTTARSIQSEDAGRGGSPFRLDRIRLDRGRRRDGGAWGGDGRSGHGRAERHRELDRFPTSTSGIRIAADDQGYYRLRSALPARARRDLSAPPLVAPARCCPACRFRTGRPAFARHWPSPRLPLRS